MVSSEKEAHVMREKYFRELDADGRIDRMHDVVNAQGARIEELEQQIYMLMRHQHAATGDVVVRPRDTRTEARILAGHNHDWF